MISAAGASGISDAPAASTNCKPIVAIGEEALTNIVKTVPARIKFAILWAIVVAGGAAAGSWALDAASAKSQLRSRALAPGGPMAFETRHGIIITDSANKARWADEQLREAVPNFVRAFGASPGRGVIVEMKYASYSKAIPKADRRWTLPWLSGYFGSGDQAGAGPIAHHFDNDSGIRHELNHLFFTASMIPSSKKFQYGGDAPDWLDEAAALAAESTTVKARRRAHFHEQVCAGRLVSLERFVTKQHPLFGAPAMQKLISERRNAGNGAPVMLTISVDRLGLPRDSLMDFYAQSNAIAEFLVEASGDPKILGQVARSLKGGASPGGRPQRWLGQFTKPGDQPLATRFAGWARASARAGRPGCSARATQS